MFYSSAVARARRGSLLVALVGLAMIAVAVVGPSADAAPSRILVCHAEGNGSYHQISISANAESAHRSHGDARIGDEVPGMDGYEFDANCEPVALAPITRLAHATSGGNLVMEWWDSNRDGEMSRFDTVVFHQYPTNLAATRFSAFPVSECYLTGSVYADLSFAVARGAGSGCNVFLRDGHGAEIFAAFQNSIYLWDDFGTDRADSIGLSWSEWQIDQSDGAWIDITFGS